MVTAHEIAAAIVKRHRERERFQSVRGLVGGDLSLAYDIQDHVIRELADDTAARDNAAGYKIGLTTPRMQAMCGIDQPIAGVVFAGQLHTSPAGIAAAPFVRLGVESEIAVQLGRPLPHTANLDAANLLACLSQVCAAFELIDDGNADYTGLDAVSLVADNSWNAGLVLGPPTPAANFQHLKNREGVLFRNGEAVEQGNSSDVMGDPLEAVVCWRSIWRGAVRPCSPGSGSAPGVFVRPNSRLRGSATGSKSRVWQELRC